MSASRAALRLRRSQPSALALVLLAGLALWLAWGCPSPCATVVGQDSTTYLYMAELGTPYQLLTNVRTPGYPLFLRGLLPLCPDRSCVPFVHRLLVALAVAGLWLGLTRWGLSGWTALVAAGPVLFSPLVQQWSPLVMTDVPAAALAVGAVALLLAAVARPGHWTWLALGALVAATWLVRPAYLFLVPLVPLAGVGLAWLRGGSGSGEGKPARWRALGVLALVTLGPFLAYSALRWIVAGHFAAASFGGFNAIGIAASLINDRTVATLPAEDRPLAEEIQRRRKRAGLAPIRRGSRMALWWQQYTPNVWDVAVPAVQAQVVADHGIEKPGAPQNSWVHVEMNRRLSRLSLRLLAQRKGLYGRWLAYGWRHALASTWARPEVRWPAVALAVGVVLTLLRRRQAALRPALALPALATAYYLAAMTLVLLVEPAVSRYLWAAEILLPGFLLAGVVEVGKAVVAHRALPAA
ncbi:MAG TPA: hypothetical protein VF017_13215 [Thermoanaerobaculia bacterium]|nr:hypothetical protein [Thermoanaerobaculia bacterium]